MLTLTETLSEAQFLGFLGPGSISGYLEHSQGFLDVIRNNKTPAEQILDLGSGGGIPGLFLASLLADSKFVLLDANLKRCEFLTAAVRSLKIADRVKVICNRAEIAGRDPSLRGRFSFVVARGFAQPGVTAECAAPFLTENGILIVSEPPSTDENQGDDKAAISDPRWPESGCRQLGLAIKDKISHPYSFMELQLIAPCSEKYPRRNGVPNKKPIF